MTRQNKINEQLEKLESKSTECVALALKISALIGKNEASMSRTAICVVQHKAILNFDSSVQLLLALLKIKPEDFTDSHIKT